MLRLAIHLLTYLPTLALGFSFGAQFIRDVVNSEGVDRCDFGYVSDQNEPKITNQIIATLAGR